VIDTDVVTDWRRRHRAPGLVERAACARLRALAAAVPAGEAIVELGAYRGRATGWLLLGAQEGHGAHVTSVDPWEQRAGQDYEGRIAGVESARPGFEEYTRRIGATGERLTVRQGYAADVGRSWSGPPVGLLWHDAGHGAEEVAADLAVWLPHMAPGAVVALHDAGNPLWGVTEGARRVLVDAPGWDWGGRELTLWARRPERRGLLLVRHTGGRRG
jgi:hypothetical protein